MRKLSITLVLLTSILTLVLSNESKYYFRNINVEDGLSQNMIYSIIQDNVGFIWFGTQDGLNRFDGVDFKVFKKNIINPYSIGSNAIFSLLQLNSEQMWVGTDEGIYQFNPVNERFTYLRIRTKDKRNITGIVRDIKQDKNGSTWFIIQNEGLFCYLKNGKMILFPIKDVNLRRINFDLKGNVWIATYNKGLMKYNPQNNTLANYLISNSPTNSSENDINDICLLNSDQLMVGTVNRGVQLFNLSTNQYIPLLEKGVDDKPLYVRRIYKAENQKLWIGTESGLYIYNLKSNETIHLPHSSNDPYSLSDNAIHSIFQDREGGMWIGTYFGGVNYYSKSFSNFEKYYPLLGKNSISGKSISEFCEDDNKNIWIGTEDAGLNLFNPVTGLFSSGYIPAMNIHSLLFDKGKLWVGTFSNGLYVLDLKNNKIIAHYKSSSSKNSLKDGNIYSIYKDSSGTLWIGTMTGLHVYNPNSNDFTRVKEDLIKNQVNDIIEDYKGVLWFATIGDGVFLFDRFSKQWSHYKNPMGAKSSGAKIICFLEDSKNQIWLGSEGGGLCSFDINSQTFSEAITSQNGLPNDVIYKLIEELGGNIWGSTNKGLFMLNVENKEILTYDHSNGLLGNQYNYKSGIITKDGKVYFGGVKGFVAFYPNKLTKNELVPPPIVINDFKIQDNTVAIGDQKSQLEQSIIHAQSIDISPKVSTFSIEFAALSYAFPMRNHFAYMLEGKDNNWVYSNNIRQVSYSNLKPGTYLFKVKGSNSEDLWNEEGTSIKINILSPWYKTSWMYLIYYFIFILIAGRFIIRLIKRSKTRHQNLLKELENRKEKELYTSKITFFTNITHEIRTPLTLIKAPLDEVLKHTEDSDINKSNLSIIQRNVNRLLNLANELLVFRETEKNGMHLNFIKSDVIILINEVVSNFGASAELKGIRIDCNFCHDTFFADIDPEVFVKILTNILSNALKHANEFIEIILETNELDFTVRISNDGDVINEQYVEKIFEPFFKINPNVFGNGIGLPFVKSLVELHKGNVYYDKLQTDKVTFVITLPINQEYAMNIAENESFNIHEEKILEQSYINIDNNLFPTVLVVEDNEEFQQFLCTQLSNKYHVLKASNGKETMEILYDKHVDIIVSDIMMPIMNGLELCEKVKGDITISHIPIILLTAKTSLTAKIEGFNCGADEYIEKPYSFDYLTSRIDNLLEMRKKIKEAYKHSPVLAYQSITHTQTDEKFVNSLVEFIHNHLDEVGLDVGMIANAMNMSRPTLYRKLRDVSELTPNDFIQLVRLKKAAELLKQNELQISEIAYMVGFNSPNYFSKCFYKQFGVLPKNFHM